MLERLCGSSLRRAAGPVLLLALAASLLVVMPAQTAAAVSVARDDSLVSMPQPTFGPGRLKNATPMTQGCIVARTRQVKHLKKGAPCAPRSRKVAFKVEVATPLCMMPGGPLKSYRNREACLKRGGIPVRGLGNNKMLFCAVPGQEVRWVGKRRKCVGRERAFTLRNHRPISLTLGGGTVDENAGPAALVGTLTTVDVDPGDVHRYHLVTGAGSEDNSLFRIVNGELLTRDSLDHEASETRRVRVRVRDFRHGRLTKSFTIQVNDLNETPTTLALTGDTIGENEAAGTEVGILTSLDVDAGDVATYALVGTGNGNADFEISGDRLVTAASLDHETGATRTVRIRVSDIGGLSQEREFTVAVTDVNELPTALTLTRDTVAENAPAQTVVGTFEVADADGGAPYSFQIVEGVDLFVVNGQELRTAGPLDHESAATRTVRVRVTDVDGLIYTDSLRIRVIDVNEAPTGLMVDGDEVAENLPAGTEVGQLSGTDPDRADVLTFALVTGAGDADNGLFEIVGDRLHTTAPLDHEISATLSVRLRVTDAAGLSYERTFTVEVLDVNEAPTGLQISRDSVDENVAVGTVVATLSAEDQDAGDSLTFALVTGAGDSDNAYFEVVGSELHTRAPLDHEAAATRSVRLRVTDAVGAQQSRSFTVTVRDLNEGPRDLTLDHDEVAENAAAGTLVGTLAATDDDDADTLAFSLVTGDGDTDNALFKISGDQLLTRSPLDHETAATRSVRVRVTDAAGEQSARAFTLSVLDVNERPQAPTLSNDAVAENAPADTVVGRLSSSDPDAGDTVSFALATGSGDGNNHDFEIVGDELRTTRPFDFETEPTRSIRVRASDGSLSASAAFVVRVGDVDEAPTGFALSHDEIDENVVGLLGTLSAADAEGQALTFSLSAGAGDTDNGDFEIVGDELRTTVGLDFEAGETRSVRIQVSDGTMTLGKVFTVTVLDVNEAPGALALSARVVDENAAQAEIGTVSADDPDAGSTLTYSLDAGTGDTHNAQFELVGTTLRTRVPLDFEAGATRSVRILATDGTESVTEVFTINVRDRNDAPGAITLDRSSILDSAADGAVVGTLSALDEDTLKPHVFTEITGGDHAGAFEVVDAELRVAGSLVGLSGPLTVRVRVTDTWGGVTHTNEEIITVTVVPDTDLVLALDVDTVAENSAVATRVGAFTASGSGTSPYTYALVPGAADNNDFTVSGGDLVTARSFDHEVTPTRSLRVRVTDAGGQRWIRSMTVEITDVNEPPVISDASVTFWDSGVDQSYRPEGVDPEGAPLVWSLATCAQEDDNDRFELGSDAQSFVYSGVLDFEEWAPSGTVRLCVGLSDGVNETAFHRTLKIVDVNEPTTDITLASTGIDIESPVGSVVGTLTAVDPDGRKPVLAEVSAVGTHSGAGYFTVVGQELKVARDLGDLPLGGVQISVEATDAWAVQGPPVGQTHRKTLTITVKERLALTSSAATVAEGEPAGTLAATLSATGGTTPYTYALDGVGDDNALFEVVGDELRTRRPFVFATEPELRVNVLVTDGSGDVARRALVVSVSDVLLAPVAGADTSGGFVGNTRTEVDASVLGNDTDPEGGALVVAAGALPTTRGGTVTMAADGTFRYDPPVGVKNVTDTVDYEITSSASSLTDTGTLSLAITDRLVWYADAAAASTGDGTSHSPFQNLALLGQGQVGDKDKAGDEIFLAGGVYAPLTLKADQKLYGAQRGLPGLLAADPAALAKVRTATSRAAVALATGTTVDGVVIDSFGPTTGPALAATGVTSAVVTANSRIVGLTGPAVVIASGDSGEIAIAADVVGSAGSMVQVADRAGAVAFTGLVESVVSNPAARGVVISNSAGSVSFGGGLQLHTVQAAFAASGGGTVKVTGENNWLKSTGGAALSIHETSIGTAGIRLLRVDSTKSPSISLTRTGTGRLVVTGDGSDTPSQIAGILMDSTYGADLVSVKVTRRVGESPRAGGIPSVEVKTLNGPLRFTDATVAGADGNGIEVNGSTAAVVLDRTTVTGAADSGVVVTSDLGTSSVQVTDSTISGSGATGAARDGVRVVQSGSAAIATTVTGSTFEDNRGDQIQVVARGGAEANATISDNDLSSTGQGILVNAGGPAYTGRLGYDIRDNTVLRSAGIGIGVTTNGSGSGTLEGYVHDNLVGGATGQCSTGILIDAEGAGALVASVKGNQLTGCGDPVRARGAQDGSALHLALADNETPDAVGVLQVRFGRPGSTGLTCLAPGVNPGTLTSLALMSGVVGLPGYTGPITGAGVTTWLTPLVSPGALSVTDSSSGLTGSALPCLTPTF